MWLQTLCILLVTMVDASWADATPPAEGLVEANGVRLQYVDWGGTGEVVLMIGGLADNPRAFDAIAAPLASHFHVVAYSRRGTGNSDVKGPYDRGTLTEDLHGLMDAFGIQSADLIGLSAGGVEVTEMAARYPGRVRRVVYLDAAYDWEDPSFKEAVHAYPVTFASPPTGAMSSLEAFLSYEKATIYPSLSSLDGIDANLREKVIVQSDQGVRYKTSKQVVGELYEALWSNGKPNYAAVTCPALAVYATSLYDTAISDPASRAQILRFEHNYWIPFQTRSRSHLEHELSGVQVVRVPGAHVSFFVAERKRLVDLLVNFLAARSPTER
jgi:pimeloyl-ACP methyl ester carboxylesterase